MANLSSNVEQSSVSFELDAMDSLRSPRTAQRLNQIDRLRANGISEHIPLPQLVVCGDQSAGKSSVLEAITGVPFPRRDGVCTKFATEIILRHSHLPYQITATIIPHISRDEKSKTRFRRYKRRLDKFGQLPEVITEVGEVMEIRGAGQTTQGRAFAADVLRLEVVGQTGLHLTVVDLPGLIAVANEEQTEDDIALVSGLVDMYLKQSRTIILAVVQASNDIATQRIIQKAQTIDQDGSRTLGIITKPDLINKGTEQRIAILAKNQDTTKLKLGYFLLKNPTPTELESGITMTQRKQNELNFFESLEWKACELDPARVGIDALRSYVQHLLSDHIERELPKVRVEIITLLSNTERELLSLGEERSTLGQLRLFLTHLSMDIYRLSTSALDGGYYGVDSAFFETSRSNGSNRLRARIQELNSVFAENMRERSCRRKVVETIPADFNSRNVSPNSQLLVTQKELSAWAKSVYRATRGKELSGNTNFVLLAELFHEQSSLWGNMAKLHLKKVTSTVSDFIGQVLAHSIAEHHVRKWILRYTNHRLKSAEQNAMAELAKLLEDEKRQPITYNHYYTDNIQKIENDYIRKDIQQAAQSLRDSKQKTAKQASGNSKDATAKNPTIIEADIDALVASLQKRIVVNMEDASCDRALYSLDAYYKVAMKTFVDNVCRQVIERHLLADLPQVFCPTTVVQLSDDEIINAAVEPKENIQKRGELKALVQGLQNSLSEIDTFGE